MPKKCATLAQALVCLAFSVLAGAGCTNNLLNSASNALNSTLTGANPSTGTGTSNSGVVLARVQQDTFDPSGTLDMIGDGSGTLALHA